MRGMTKHTAISRRQMLLTLPALAIAPKVWAQTTGRAPIAAKYFNHFMLGVSDVQRSVDFYQGLFGMPIQARQGSTVLLRVGNGPQFLGLTPAGSNPPSITHIGLAVDGFNADRVMAALTANGVTKAAASDPGPSGGAMKAKLTMRGNTPEVFVGDPDGLIIQLQDTSYAGGTGPLGATVTVEPSPKKGLLAVTDMSHSTIQVSDSTRTVDFYQKLFGVRVQGHQAPAGSDASPFYGIGAGPQFVMFTGVPAGRGAAPGAAPAPPRPARIDHVCMSMKGFNSEAVTKALNSYGIKTQGQGEARGPMMTYISLRMPNRGGQEGGTPELYFLDPDGLSVQLQDTTYCGGSGPLGEVCAPMK
jgi:catechol 2,3-dioxygenase-like lactoylglutathione lyase family enzyme